MANNSGQQRFLPLDQGSQNNKTTLYFDSHANYDDLHELAVARLGAAYDLLDAVNILSNDFYPIDISKNTNRVTKLLISDGLSIIKHLYKEHPTTLDT